MLSELPNTWRRTARDLQRLASRFRGTLNGEEAPSRSDQYLYFQSVLGALPFGASAESLADLVPRLQAFMQKAVREAKAHSSWLHPNAEYEAAVARYVQGTLEDPAFAARLLRFSRRIEPYAASNALGQLVLKACSPGIPDTYQGAESWHQVLVDPDNRRLVDHRALEACLSALDRRRDDRLPLIRELLEQFPDGRIKLFVTSELLRLRRERPEAFATGYVPFDAGQQCVAFGRGTRESVALVCAVTRFPFRCTRGRAPWAVAQWWAEQRVSAPGLHGRYRNVLTGETHDAQGSLELSELFAQLPFAVLVR